MRPPRFRFRLSTLLVFVAVMAALIASGILTERVGSIHDATSLPGYPAFEAPMYREGWLIRLARSIGGTCH